MVAEEARQVTVDVDVGDDEMRAEELAVPAEDPGPADPLVALGDDEGPVVAALCGSGFSFYHTRGRAARIL